MIDPIQLSPAATKWLHDRGWSEMRRWDAESSIHQLTARGFTVHPMAELILERFGGMILNSCGPLKPRIVVEPDKGLNLTAHCLELLPLAEEIQSPLCPVGHGSGWIMLSAANGKIVLLDEEWTLCRVCSDLSTFFDSNIFDGVNDCLQVENLHDYIVDW